MYFNLQLLVQDCDFFLLKEVKDFFYHENVQK